MARSQGDKTATEWGFIGLQTGVNLAANGQHAARYQAALCRLNGQQMGGNKATNWHQTGGTWPVHRQQTGGKTALE
jgi:hypothetical protein